MCSSWNYTLRIALCFAFLTVNSFGELIMIRHPKADEGSSKLQLTCTSENDGSALVWNGDVIQTTGDTEFSSHLHTPVPVEYPIIDTKKRDAKGWNNTSSAQESIGPILDYRWGGRSMKPSESSDCASEITDVQGSSFAFSARGSGNIFVELCVEDNCYWQIKFEDSESTKPFIRFSKAGNLSSSCISSAKVSTRQKNIGEWRTFIIKWDADQTKIQAFINGTEQSAELGQQSTLDNVTALKIFADEYVLLRHHIYSYLVAKIDRANLTTPKFNITDGKLCFELPISLCSQCRLDVIVEDRRGSSWIIKNISGDGKTTYGGLPVWRIFKFNTTLEAGYQNPVRLKFSTAISNIGNDSLWAIGDSRPCGDTVRRSTQSFSPLSKEPDITCQKLSYTENTVVHSKNAITNISSTILDHCLQGGTGLFCDFGCNGSCNGTSICNPTGCTCAPGFKGADCNKECTEGYYGYNCQLSCGRCEGQCNKIRGCVSSQSLQERGVPLYLISLVVCLIFAACLLFIWYRLRNNQSVYKGLESYSVIYASVTPLPEYDSQSDDSIYKCCAYPLKLISFENYVRKAAENGDLEQQFTSLPRGLVRSCDNGRLPENKPKNRYGNLLPYDDTAVMLVPSSRCQPPGYINASYIQGYCKEKAYIATQGPLPDTIVDFWRMIWQEEVRVICMMVDLNEGGRKMCEKYWPAVGEELKYGDVIVMTTNQRVFADYTYRTFLVKTRRESEQLTVKHLQYTGWPEDGVPIYSHSIAEFLSKLLSTPPGQGPIVVHCSSGVGRTGTIILCDICLRYIAAEGEVDVFAEAEQMYKARANMLSTFSQYVLAHLVPTQCLLFLPTKVTCNNISQEKIAEMKMDLPVLIERLEKSSWTEKALRPIGPLKPPLAESMRKNRFPKLSPVGPSLVTLARYPTYDTTSDYISAVSVDGVKTRRKYLASQLPMPSTVTDFWRLVIEKNVELVIVLQRPDPADPTCCKIIPQGTTLIPLPWVKIETISCDSSEYFSTDKLLLTDTSKIQARTWNITFLTCNNWSLENGRPPEPQAFVELWNTSEKIPRVEGPTLVLCYDGLTGCGLYLALSFMLERMAVEQECDVILAVRAVRRSRLEFVNAEWQFEYLYDAAVKYVETFRDYDNFKSPVVQNTHIYLPPKSCR